MMKRTFFSAASERTGATARRSRGGNSRGFIFGEDAGPDRPGQVRDHDGTFSGASGEAMR
jgi:hypothetical protein